MKVFRIENPNSTQGLWYTRDGVYDPFIATIPTAEAATIPMPYNRDFKAQGLDWISASATLEALVNRFSLDDAIALAKSGYHLYEYEVLECRPLDYHVAFIRDHVVSVTRLDLIHLCLSRLNS